MAEAVLLTGATGFVGRAVLAELVARGVPVHAVSRGLGAALPGVTWHQVDLLEAAARGRLISAAQAERMIHCAWYVEHGAFWTSPLNAVWAEASVDLAARFLAAGGGRRILALGTCAEYDWQGGDTPWPETRRVAPATPYGQAKAALHDQLAGLCAAQGASLVWARLFHLYGPGEPVARLVPSLIAALAEGRVAEVRAEGLVRDFASTTHIARALVGFLDSGAQGAVNLGSGQAVTLGQVAQVLGRLMGRPDLLRLSHNPPATEPVYMVPDLTRLHAAVDLPDERLEDGLAALVAARGLRR